MPEAISVIPIGTMVNLGPCGEIKGQVLAVTVKDGLVQYQVVWWVDHARNLEWIDAIEIQYDGPKSRLGFTVEK